MIAPRTFLRGSAALPIAGALPAGARALSPADARLVALAEAMEAIHREAEAQLALHRLRETPATEAEFAAICALYQPVEDELSATPADTMVGAIAKARACQVPTLRDEDGGGVALSLADDLWRLFGGSAS